MTKKDEKSDDLGAAEVQKKVDDAEDKGYIGATPDETPNDAYTVSGVTSGKPTPETDPDVAPARQSQADVRTTAPTAKPPAAKK